MPKKSVAGAMLLGLVGFFGCSTPETIRVSPAPPKETLTETIQAPPRQNLAASAVLPPQPERLETKVSEPSITEPAAETRSPETYASLLERYRAARTLAECLVFYLEDKRNRPALREGMFPVTVAYNFEILWNSHEYRHGAKIEKTLGRFGKQVFDLEFRGIFSHRPKADLIQKQATRKGVDEANAENFIFSLTLVVDGEKYTDDAHDGIVDRFERDGITYIRSPYDGPDVFTSGETPNPLNAKEIQDNYLNRLEQARSVYK